MEAIRLSAHFDGNTIVLDEPFDMEPNTRLLITIVQSQTVHEGREWLQLSRMGLENAFGTEEPEYTLDTLLAGNPDYEAR